MNAVVGRLLESAWAEAAGWALVHFLWQGAAVAVLAAMVLRLMARRSSTGRYAVGIAALVLLAAMPLATAAWVATSRTPPLQQAQAVAPRGDLPLAVLDRASASVATPGIEAIGDYDPPAIAEDRTPIGIAGTAPDVTWLPTLSAWLRPRLPYCVAVWLAGVSLLSLRLAISWLRVQRWRRSGVRPIVGSLAERFETISRRLAVSRPVRLFESTLIEVPTVIGWLRPVILLPVSAATGLSASELEMILAHELAHVRRHDYLVNLAQTVVETLLFYHPAVWWLSARIRQERENCCDDIAVAACGDSVRYARALATLEQLRAPASQLAVAAGGGSLLARIRRLLGREPAERLLGGHLVGGALLVALVVILMWTTSSAHEPAEITSLEVKLNEEVRIEVLGVSQQTSPQKPWWKPWGPALPGNPFGERWPNLPASQTGGEGEYREFALRIDSQNDDLMSNVDFPPEFQYGSWSAGSSSQREDSGESVRLIYVSRAFTKGEKSVDLIVRLGLEPWREWVTLPLEAPLDVPEVKADNEAEAGKLRIERVFEHPGAKNTEIVITWPKDFDRRAAIEVESIDQQGQAVQLTGVAGGQNSRGFIFPRLKSQLASFRYRLRWHTHEVAFDGISLNPGQETTPVAGVRELTPAPQAEELTTAKISAEIKAAMRRFESVEYATTFKETRNANGFVADKPLLPVEGTGATEFRSDGERWQADESDFSLTQGQAGSWPQRTVSGFDGETYHSLRDHKMTLGEHELSDERLRPKKVFWRGARSAEWLLYAIDYFNARVERREPIGGHDCVVIVAEPGRPKPGEPADESNRRTVWRYEITISPDQSWLPIKTVVSMDGAPYATETIDRLAQTPDGVWYPESIHFQQHATPAWSLAKETVVTRFRLRDRFEDNEFGFAVPLGVDVVDYRRGRAWHNDPWWPELAPWLRENLDWPRPDLTVLRSLTSAAQPELEGQPAIDIRASEWLNLGGAAEDAVAAGTTNPPAAWNRAGRKLTVLFFFEGYAINPVPQWIAGLKGLQDRYGPYGLEIIGIASPAIDSALARRMVRALDISFPVAIDAKSDQGLSQSDYTAYGTRGYRGAYLVDAEGKVRLISRDASANDHESPLENRVRELLVAAGATAVDRPERESFARRLSLDVTGLPPTAQDLESIANDEDADWAVRYAERLQLTGEQQNWLKSYGITFWNTVKQAQEGPSSLSAASVRRIEERWLRLARQRNGTASIGGRVAAAAAADAPDIQGLQAKVEVMPVLRLLSTNAPANWTLIYDRDRKVTVDTDQDGRFSIDGLVMGSYELIFIAPGHGRIEQTVHLADDDSQVNLRPQLPPGDAIGGTVVDTTGNPIVGASVRAVGRRLSPDLPPRTTTARLPRGALKTDAQGGFRFGGLYEGNYTLEIEAAGFARQTVELIPVGKLDLRVELRPPLPASPQPE